MDEKRLRIAKALCDAGIIKFGDFTLTSGKKSPVYVDLRVLGSFPESFHAIVKEMSEIVKKLNAEVVAGIETAGIPLATGISMEVRIPMVYVRKKAKGYGTNSGIEGSLRKGQRAVLIDDMTTDGGSKIESALVLRNEGIRVDDVLVVLDREQGGKENLARHNLNLHSLITLRELLEHMRENGLIGKEKFDEVINYLE